MLSEASSYGRVLIISNIKNSRNQFAKYVVYIINVCIEPCPAITKSNVCIEPCPAITKSNVCIVSYTASSDPVNSSLVRDSADRWRCSPFTPFLAWKVNIKKLQETYFYIDNGNVFAFFSIP